MDKQKKILTIGLGSLVVLLVVYGIWKMAIGKPVYPYLSAKDPTVKYQVLPTSTTSKIKSGQDIFAKAQYVGSETCKTCHAQQYNDWKQTWHSKMERPLKPDEVVGDFNDVVLNLKGIEIAKDPGAIKKEIVKADVTVKAHKSGDKYFFTLVDDVNPANSQTYEVTYLIGGAWEQLYETKIGDNLYPAPIRWVVEDKAWRSKGFNTFDWYKIVDGKPVPRKPNEVMNDKSVEAKCSGCHDTGYKPITDPTTNKVTGNSREMGISCEACHGPGSQHVSGGGDRSKIVNPVKDLDTLQQNQLCGQCHSRVQNKDNKNLAFPLGYLPGDKILQDKVSFWSYSFGGDKPEKLWWPNEFAKANRQQYQDLKISPHAQTNTSCITCHTGHGKRVQGLGLLRVNKDEMCSNCHSQQGVTGKPNVEMYSGSVMQKAGVTCVDCHMAKIAQRADVTKVKTDHWDASSHTFIATSPETKTNWGVRSSCEQCHSQQGKANLKFTNKTELKAYTDVTKKVRSDIDSLLSQLDLVDKTIISKNGAGGASELSSQAHNNLDFILQDGSYGFHNPTRTNQIIEDIKAKVNQAKSKLGLS